MPPRFQPPAQQHQPPPPPASVALQQQQAQLGRVLNAMTHGGQTLHSMDPNDAFQVHMMNARFLEQCAQQRRPATAPPPPFPGAPTTAAAAARTQPPQPSTNFQLQPRM